MKWETLDEDQIADIMEGREVRPPKPGASAKADAESRAQTELSLIHISEPTRP